MHRKIPFFNNKKLIFNNIMIDSFQCSIIPTTIINLFNILYFIAAMAILTSVHLCLLINLLYVQNSNIQNSNVPNTQIPQSYGIWWKVFGKTNIQAKYL